MRAFTKGMFVGVTASAVLAGGSVLAGTGVGGVFNLGQHNTVNAKTELTGSVSGASQLTVTNTSSTHGSAVIAGYAAADAPAIIGGNSATGVGLQGSSVDGVGISATSQSKTAPAAKISNIGGGAGLRIDTISDAPPLVVNSSTKVDNLNADKLDGLDGASFSRLLAMRAENPVQTLHLGNNYILGSGFTPAADGRCLVTVSVQVFTYASTGGTGGDPDFLIAIKRGTAPITHEDFDLAVQLPYSMRATDPAGISDELTRSATFDVTRGTPVRFGAYLWSFGGDFVGKHAYVDTTYLCMTTGTYPTAQSPRPPHSHTRRPSTSRTSRSTRNR